MSQQEKDPRLCQNFQFGRCSYDPASGVAQLVYRLEDGPELVETLTFPHAPWPPEASRQAAFGRALELLHWLAGVSYYKAVLAPNIDFETVAPGHELMKFLREVYVEGLAEFAYVNQVSVAERFKPEASSIPVPDAIELLLAERALVAMGGGKDSLVGLRLLQSAGLEVMPICVGSSSLISDTVRAAGLPLLRIGRKLAPELADLNAAGAWNGHIPVTAINSAILTCAAILYGFKYVVFSNERSADEATLVTSRGVAVNHQYSKTSQFEHAFQGALKAYVSPDIDYFSILRPFSELEIIRRFCQLPEFHAVFSSCNRNFHQHGRVPEGRWCGDCPKCRFAALGMAVFLEPEQVQAIQGANLLNDESQLDGFRALCGLGQDKPFECVGEAGESRAALAALADKANWNQFDVVRRLAGELKDLPVPSLSSLLQPSEKHFVPARLASALVQAYN